MKILNLHCKKKEHNIPANTYIIEHYILIRELIFIK